ncbi:MAG TPA: oligopeptidase A [Gammaproteobacteria bacterium]|nr:oligopeptidase A [Gammaproteobacteria bacterium]
MDNPLLNMQGLPAFSQIRPEHVEPAIDALLAENRARIDELLTKGSKYTWENLIHPLEMMDDRLSRVWSPVRHMNSVVNSEALRVAYNACLPKLSEYGTELGQNERLFQAYQSIRNSDTFARLDVAQRKTIEDALRDFRLSGVHLPAADKERLKAIQQELSRAQSKFEENLLDATRAWKKHITDEAKLSGLPESALAMAQQTARNNGLKGWQLTLETPSFIAVMTYADDRELRRELYTAHNTRASDQGPHAGRWDNSEVMEQILRLRYEAARLLGFANYADKSFATKMAASPHQVIEFINDLVQRAKPVAEQELADLRSFAAAELGITDLQPWDIAYVSEKLRQRRYALSQEDLRPYFPVDRVLAGLFGLVQRLYGFNIEQRNEVDTWHPDVRFYQITDANGAVRGQFYLDLYAREHKRGGAWMDECVNRMRTESGVQIPVAYMTCNSSPPIDGKPALFTHDEVITLFHEFGHGLHHMLTLVDYPEVSGINGVEWDAVEMPSQFMENWCWEREALDLFAKHYQTGEPLPDDLYRKLIAARHFLAGMQMLRQLEFALFDLRLHLEYDPQQGGRIQALVDEVRDAVAVVKPPSFVRFQHSFAHIFAGGYGAGYYSYKWAEVLSADVFAAFEEHGLFDREIGRRFLHCVLERGGTKSAMELFKDFRNREPRIDALLRHNGLAA